jgi:hypothetical protein
MQNRQLTLRDRTQVLPGCWPILGRADAITGNRIKAKAAYQDFFTLWKGADRDIPILKGAKAEYAKLQ